MGMPMIISRPFFARLLVLWVNRIGKDPVKSSNGTKFLPWHLCVLHHYKGSHNAGPAAVVGNWADPCADDRTALVYSLGPLRYDVALILVHPLRRGRAFPTRTGDHQHLRVDAGTLVD